MLNPINGTISQSNSTLANASVPLRVTQFSGGVDAFQHLKQQSLWEKYISWLHGIPALTTEQQKNSNGTGILITLLLGVGVIGAFVLRPNKTLKGTFRSKPSSTKSASAPSHSTCTSSTTNNTTPPKLLSTIHQTQTASSVSDKSGQSVFVTGQASASKHSPVVSGEFTQKKIKLSKLNNSGSSYLSIMVNTKPKELETLLKDLEPHEIEDLLTTVKSHNGKTVFQEAAMLSQNPEAFKIMLTSLKDYPDRIERMLLARDSSGWEIAHRVADIGNYGKTGLLDAILINLKDHPNKIEKILLTRDSSGKSAINYISNLRNNKGLEPFISVMNSLENHPESLKKESVP